MWPQAHVCVAYWLDIHWIYDLENNTHCTHSRGDNHHLPPINCNIKLFFPHTFYFQLNDEEEQKEDEKFLEALGEIEDEFLSEYRLRRIEEMRKALESV